MSAKKWLWFTVCLGVIGFGFYIVYNKLYDQYYVYQEDELLCDELDLVALQHVDDDQNNDTDVPAVESFVVKIPQHLFTQLDKVIFYTPQERKDFFKQRGMQYCNQTMVDYEPLLNYQIKASDKYLSNQNEYELLTEVYGDDIALQTLMPMSIRWISPEVGYGIFAEDDLSENGFIGVYGGVVKDRQLVDNKDYAWVYPEQTLEGGRITLDAKEQGNELSLINDGRDPNCAVQYILGFDGLWHVCYLATKDIKKGEQLLISYGPAYWDTREYGYQELAV